MIRKIIKIDAALCTGCGICVAACHEGAIGLSGGKAVLLRDDYCDGLGDCLPTCPEKAISFEERDALAYDDIAVKAAMGCARFDAALKKLPESRSDAPVSKSSLMQWPVQIKLAPLEAPYFNNAHLLIAADCCAYACANFHQEFMRNKITLIGCPKLDATDYSDKLTAILANNDILSVTLARMEVPCCGGLEVAVKNAVFNSNKSIPFQVITLLIDGSIKK